jgi:hypothetical protein
LTDVSSALSPFLDIIIAPDDAIDADTDADAAATGA